MLTKKGIKLLLLMTVVRLSKEGQRKWIPKEERSEVIIQTHKLFYRAVTEKVYYIKEKFNMEENLRP